MHTALNSGKYHVITKQFLNSRLCSAKLRCTNVRQNHKNSNRFQIGPFSKVGTVLTLKENNHDCLFILFLMFEIVKYYLELKNNLEI